MGNSAHDVRDLLALARLLRRFAQKQDARHALFLDTATALEQRAISIANADRAAHLERKRERDSGLHAPINLLI